MRGDPPVGERRLSDSNPSLIYLAKPDGCRWTLHKGGPTRPPLGADMSLFEGRHVIALERGGGERRRDSPTFQNSLGADAGGPFARIHAAPRVDARGPLSRVHATHPAKTRRPGICDSDGKQMGSRETCMTLETRRQENTRKSSALSSCSEGNRGEGKG